MMVKRQHSPKDKQLLLKKGVGHSSHWSDVICSTVGWFEEAGQQLEYRKNYDGYWTGELFMKQVSKTLPRLCYKH
jgi:hypothetical protein